MAYNICPLQLPMLVLNYALHNEHLKILYSMASIASRPNLNPLITKNLAQYEQFYGFTASSILVPNLSPLESAYRRLQELVAAGAVRTPSDPSRFVYPSFRGDIQEEMEDDVGFYARNNAAPAEAAAESSAPRAVQQPYADSPSDFEASKRDREEKEAELERRRKEQEAKQAKVQAEKEQEAQQRKLIKEQIEKDRVERARQEDERKAARLAAELQATTSLAPPSSSLQPPSAGSSPTSTSPSVSPRKHSPPISVPAPASTLEAANYQQRGHWAVRSTTPPNGAVSSSSQTSSHTQNQAPSGHHGPSHAAASASSSAFHSNGTSAADPLASQLPSRIYAQYRVHLERLRIEEQRTLQLLRTLEALQRVNPSPQLDDTITEHRHRLELYYRDMATITTFLKTEGMRSTVAAPPPEPVGFTLRDASKDLAYEDEEAVEARPLQMVDGTATWRVRVQMPQGDPITLTIHPSHTVLDLFQHLASVTSITTSFKLEIVGKPGELDMAQTAEQAGLRMTTLRLSRR